MKTTVFGFLLVAVTTYVAINAASITWNKPAFCHSLECPVFHTTEHHQGYEKRHYEVSKWVATSLYTFEFTEEQNRQMFYKLFYYISGNNSMHSKIEMTAPVVLKVEHGPGPTCESNFTMYFMVPFELQANTPTPTESDVFLADMQPFDVYVRSFGGRPTLEDKMNQLIQLADAINDTSKYDSSSYMFTGYDGPYSVHPHNEVWLPAIN